MRSAFTAIALLIRSTLGAWRGYPQIVPPQDCTCDAALGQQLSDLRKKHAAAAARLPPMTIFYNDVRFSAFHGVAHIECGRSGGVQASHNNCTDQQTHRLPRNRGISFFSCACPSRCRSSPVFGPGHDVPDRGKCLWNRCGTRSSALPARGYALPRRAPVNSMLATRCTWRKSGSRCLCSRQRT